MSYIVAVVARWTKSLKLTLSIAVHRGGLAKNDFWLVTKQKKKIGEQLNYFWNMCSKPFSWTKNKRKLFSDGKSRGTLLAGAALNHIAKENYQLISWSELISEGRSWKSLANGRSRADPSILQVFSDYLIASWDLYWARSLSTLWCSKISAKLVRPLMLGLSFLSFRRLKLFECSVALDIPYKGTRDDIDGPSYKQKFLKQIGRNHKCNDPELTRIISEYYHDNLRPQCI